MINSEEVIYNYLEAKDLYNNEDSYELVTSANFIIPEDSEYIDFNEETEEWSPSYGFCPKCSAYGESCERSPNGKTTCVNGHSYSHNERVLASEYQGKKVTLNKPFRTPKGPKKSSVYVKNDKGNVVKVNFGDPNMSIKKNIPSNRKSFRARHKCDTPGPKWKARYWSCKAW